MCVRGGDYMELSRNEARVVVMKILYQINLYDKNKIDYDVEEVITDNIEEANEFISSLVYGVIDKTKELDEISNKYLKNWTMDRLGFVDQAIIRVGLYELLYTETPNKVCIDQAVEISKQYSDEAVVKMINGVLDKVYHNECNGE